MPIRDAAQCLNRRMGLCVLTAAAAVLCVPCAAAIADLATGQRTATARLSLPLGLLAGTLAAGLLVRCKGRYIGMYIVAALGQCAPCAVLFLSCDVALVQAFASFAAALAFLLLCLRRLPLRAALCAVALQAVCVVAAVLTVGVGALSCCRPAGCGESMRPLQVGNDLFPFAVLCALCVLQQGARDGRPAGDCILQVVSHEIFSPLHVIAGHAGLLAKKDGVVGEWGTEIAAHCSQLSAKFAMMIDFARMSEGNLQATQHKFPTRRVLSEAVNSVRSKAVAKGVRVQLIPEANAPHEILGDELRTLQALHCLMDNAIKYSAPLDVVQLQLSAVQVVEGREAVRFTVKDNGAGMGAQTLRSAVLPFVRDTGRINTQAQGLGLGLSIAHYWAERMGGALRLSSPGPGQGSTAVLTLPTNIASPQPLPQELRSLQGTAVQLRGFECFDAASRQLEWLGLRWELNRPSADSQQHAGRLAVRLGGEAPSGWRPVAVPATPVALLEAIRLEPLSAVLPLSKAVVLVVDDSATNRQLLRFKLESWGGFECEEAENGARAVERVCARGVPYDAILMDVDMPVMDGLEATRQIRQRGVLSPVYAVTANAGQSVAAECRVAGMTRVFTKPVRWSELQETLTLSQLPDPASSVSNPDSEVLPGRVRGTNPFDSICSNPTACIMPQGAQLSPTRLHALPRTSTCLSELEMV